jgi:hypothetical protein
MSKKKADLEWKNRKLCSDGNCIGVIGPDGLCKECGKPYEGKLPEDFSVQKNDSAKENVSLEVSEADEPTVDDKIKESQEDLEWEKRRLCSDGNCIGVIGPNDRCKECGKPLESV